MYKVKMTDLEAIKKQLIANNKFLANHICASTSSKDVNKMIKANEKQIKKLEDEYYIS